MAGRRVKMALLAAAIAVLAGCGSGSFKATSGAGSGVYPRTTTSDPNGSQATTSTTVPASGAAPASAVSEITGVSVAAMGVAATPGDTAATISAAGVTSPKAIQGPASLGGAKPTVFYAGAEYCPYCAAERWAMVMALSKFGTFSHLGQTTSSSTDVNQDSPTFTFVGSTYTSQWLNLQTVEEQDRKGKTLQKPTTAQKQFTDKYDNPPYVSSSSAQSIPFVLFGSQFLLSGSQWDGKALAKQSFTAVAAALGNAHPNPGTPLGGAALSAQAAAGKLVGVLCAITDNKPPVCPTVPASLRP